MGLSFFAMFFILSKALYFLILPFTWIIALFLYSLFTPNPTRKRISCNLALVFLIVFSNPYVSQQALRTLEGPHPLPLTETYSVGVVLTGMVESGVGPREQVSLNESADRIVTAVRLYKTGKIEKILLSGGAADMLYPEANEGKELYELALDLGIPATDLISEKQSRNTYENALFIGKLIEPDDKVLLITSAFHMPRARRCFEKQGIEITPYPVDFRAPDAFKWAYMLPSVSAFGHWNTVIKEWVGLVAYKLKAFI